MTVIDSNQKIIPWYKECYVWMIIFFPMLAVVGGIITIILAIQSNDGLVVDDYYKEGLEINRTLERDQSAMKHELAVDIKLMPAMEEVIIRLMANTEFNYPEKIQVTFLSATRSGLDQKALLIQTENHTYRGNLPALTVGKWYVHIEHDDWRLIKTLFVEK